MAEVKNAFIKSKMNKDLDARLIPQGEYRDAVNVQVSKSEGDDVGALENILGNFSIGDFIEDSGVTSELTCIGYFVNDLDSTVYLFFTDYTDPYATTFGSTYNKDAENFIYSFKINSSNPIKKLVQGAFLNFSTNRPIIGVNVLEDFLFFTDNRNQPRKININKAINEGINYYQTEDQISIAKYYPYQCINVFKPSGKELGTLGAIIATADVSGPSVVNSKEIPIDNVILYGTDPIEKGLGVRLNNGGADLFAYIVDMSSPTQLTLNRPVTLIDNTSLRFVRQETSMYDKFSQYIPLNDSNTPNIINPYWAGEDSFGNDLFAGDPQYLEDKFVRFSYRFKFEDGEYSLIAPFTQPCFIPKQDGYFLQGDERLTFASTVVGFMENKVNTIDLQIPLPSAASSLKDNLHISEVDIIYKESDGLALQVVETIPVSAISGDNPFFQYTYLSQKPYKTLPESEITRVYDKVPVRAFGQEIISNRVVYSNFQTKHTPPDFINYQVAATEKYESNEIAKSQFSALSTIEYPNHTIKQNRNYQVGIILADKYGRQSTTILSNNTEDAAAGGFGADTVYLPYRSVNDSIIFNGDSLKVLFNDPISSLKNESKFTPGLYNEDINSPSYNPLGWYSYKIVVKQIEQEYYNVYNNGAIKGDPLYATTNENQNTSFITLLNDNINKVPRDLSEVGPQDKTFRSSVRLFGRVDINNRAFSNVGNEQYIPDDSRLSFTTNAIEDLFDLFDVLQLEDSNGKVIPVTDNQNPYYAFYKAESNPFIGEFVTSQNNFNNQFGVVNKDNAVVGNNNPYVKYENLSILETAPVVSRLDLFFETSTSGLINELNIAIAEDTGGAFLVENFNYDHKENYQIGTDLTTDFHFEDVLGVELIPDSVSLSVQDSLGNDRTSDFQINPGFSSGSYSMQTSNYFYYGQNAGNKESYTFTFTVDANGSVTELQESGSLTNSNPIIQGFTRGQVTTAPAVNKLIDANATFFCNNVLVGQLVLDEQNIQSNANVVSIDSNTQITLNASIFEGPQNYSIFKVTATGESTSFSPFKLIDNSASFDTTVNVGDFVIDDQAPFTPINPGGFGQTRVIAQVISVDSPTQLTLNADISQGPIFYSIYKKNIPFTGETIFTKASDAFVLKNLGRYAQNGSSNCNPNTQLYTQNLTFSIESQGGAGSFQIDTNGVDVINTDTNAVGSGFFILKLCDDGSPDQLCVTQRIDVLFGEDPVPQEFIREKILQDTEGTALWLTQTNTGLLDDLPSYLGGLTPMNNLNGVGIPTFFPGNADNVLCSNVPSFGQTRFYNVAEQAPLSQGVFYVWIYGQLSDNPQTGSLPPSSINVRWNMGYRENDTNPWTFAQDINGNAMGGAGGTEATWTYEDPGAEGLTDNNYNFWYGDGFAVVNRYPYNQGYNSAQGGKVLAFSNVGDYRLLIGNLESVYGGYRRPQTPPTTDPANGTLLCGSFNDANTIYYQLGDFYSPRIDFQNNNGELYYEYEIATSNTCSTSFTATTERYYAREPFAKYVTQLYTDTGLTQTASLISGIKRFRRLVTIGDAGVPSNPEFCKDGAYTASFTNGNQFTGYPTPCTF
jgi:hypothetical protein